MAWTDQENAFPVPITGDGYAVGDYGMSLRDYFAARAMEALLARSTPTIEDYPRDIAEVAYDYADAMLEARKQNVKDT